MPWQARYVFRQDVSGHDVVFRGLLASKDIAVINEIRPVQPVGVKSFACCCSCARRWLMIPFGWSTRWSRGRLLTLDFIISHAGT